jgi:hypothetical protein
MTNLVALGVHSVAAAQHLCVCPQGMNKIQRRLATISRVAINGIRLIDLHSSALENQGVETSRIGGTRGRTSTPVLAGIFRGQNRLTAW